MKKQIKVLVVDDSSFARELINAVLSTDSEIIVVGEAGNGRDAVRKVEDLKPDVVTMDIEMPVMGGLEAIEEIMASHAVPILVVSSRSDAKTAYETISKGALDLVAKPDINIEDAAEFIAKIKMLSKIKVVTHLKRKKDIEAATGMQKPFFNAIQQEKLVAIASSTGGPEALSVILSGLPENLPCPVVAAQHIADGFLPGMVQWLQRNSRTNVKIAAEGEQIVPGTVYISPSEKNMKISRGRLVSLIDRQPEEIYRPSCDTLLMSAASVYGSNAVGIILTGMGSDGVKGMKSIKDARGITIAQDEKSSVVYGMNKVAVDSGCVDRVLPLDRISGEIINIMKGK